MLPFVATTVVSLIALGMAAAFYSADRDSPISRALAAAWASTAASYGINVPFTAMEQAQGRLLPWAGVLGMLDAVSLFAFLEWVVRVRRTVATGHWDAPAGNYLLRFGQLVTLAYGVLSLAYPEIKLHDFYDGAQHPDVWSRPGFWLFAAGPLEVLCSGGFCLALLFWRRPDAAERLRVLGAFFSGPFLIGAPILPPDIGALSMAVGETIFLVGAVQYHIVQGRRGEFMARFLSPQVVDLVRQSGLDRAIQHRQSEISVVCCDLRGFTAYAASHPSGTVIELLREYYDLAGESATKVGATIKDFAGDGVLFLVGAPIEQPDHAARALRLARDLRLTVTGLTDRWSDATAGLGVGVGVATGVVTVGVINSTSRLEYTAVGAAVNLASRLCAQAQHREILADPPTIRLAAPSDFMAGTPAALHGLSEPQPLFANRV